MPITSPKNADYTQVGLVSADGTRAGAGPGYASAAPGDGVPLLVDAEGRVILSPSSPLPPSGIRAPDFTLRPANFAGPTVNGSITQESAAGAGTSTPSVTSIAEGYLRRELNTAAVPASAASTVWLQTGVGGNGLCFRGTTDRAGGFRLEWFFTLASLRSANDRGFHGLTAQGHFLGVDNPAALLNVIGMGWASGEANMSLYHADGVASEAEPLGVGFPADPWQLFVLELQCAPFNVAAQPVQWTARNITTDSQATGSLDGSVGQRIPAGATLLGLTAGLNNGGDAAAVNQAWILGNAWIGEV